MAIVFFCCSNRFSCSLTYSILISLWYHYGCELDYARACVCVYNNKKIYNKIIYTYTY